jgi:hypothetical protein
MIWFETHFHLHQICVLNVFLKYGFDTYVSIGIWKIFTWICVIGKSSRWAPDTHFLKVLLSLKRFSNLTKPSHGTPLQHSATWLSLTSRESLLRLGSIFLSLKWEARPPRWQWLAFLVVSHRLSHWVRIFPLRESSRTNKVLNNVFGHLGA